MLALVEVLHHPGVHPRLEALVGSGEATARALLDAEVLSRRRGCRSR